MGVAMGIAREIGGTAKHGRGLRAVVLAAPLVLAGCVNLGWSEPADFYAYAGAKMPAGRTVTVCHAYFCQQQSSVTFTEAEIERLRLVFAPVQDAATERAAAADAVGLIERLVGERVGTAGDKGLLYPPGSGDPGQQDCVDEAANTTSYLLLMKNEGLIRFHSVEEPALRGMFIDGRWQHYTAVLEENATGDAYAVDSWPRDNGNPAIVMPLRDWYLEWRSQP